MFYLLLRDHKSSAGFRRMLHFITAKSAYERGVEMSPQKTHCLGVQLYQ